MEFLGRQSDEVVNYRALNLPLLTTVDRFGPWFSSSSLFKHIALIKVCLVKNLFDVAQPEGTKETVLKLVNFIF